jgi:dTDP-4-amino-4,6-dideoxygalactose transaminase
MDDIQNRRKHIWHIYDEVLRGHVDPQRITIPALPGYAPNNAHMYYLVCDSLDSRTRLMDYLKANGVQATFHYLPLHSSTYYREHHEMPCLPQADRYGDCLVRLPLYYELTDEEAARIASIILSFEEGGMRIEL